MYKINDCYAIWTGMNHLKNTKKIESVIEIKSECKYYWAHQQKKKNAPCMQ